MRTTKFFSVAIIIMLCNTLIYAQDYKIKVKVKNIKTGSTTEKGYINGAKVKPMSVLKFNVQSKAITLITSILSII